ncbi:Peptidase S72 domain-containing protein [Aphelenchoides bicaudatus]|nr:Peptidase S72 domain-containing protein [Aphelenchoides bicaudatus]
MRLLCVCAFLAIAALGFAEESVNVAIGQLFEFGLNNDQIDPRGLPVWIGFDKDTKQIFGIPRWDHFENVTLKTQKDLQVEINTKAELEPCDAKDYVFVEVYEEKDFASFSAADLRLKIKEFAETYEIEQSEVRAFSSADLDKYRRVTQSAITLDKVVHPGQLVLWIRLGCGDLYDKEDTDIFAKAAEQSGMGAALRLGQGQILRDNVLALQTATPASASRTTRALIDSKPVLYNKITTIKCKRGIICQKWLPYNTFTDEDGYLTNLHPKVFSSGDHPTFLNITYNKNNIILEGIALETGTFGFRLEVRDKLDQINDAPFNVEVEESRKANHVYRMSMKSRLQKFRDQPALLTLFVRRLTSYVGGKPEDILIDSLEPGVDADNSVLNWSNYSYSIKSCAENQINETASKMLNAKQNVQHSFRKAMGAEFHVSNIEVQLSGTCAPGATTIQISNIRASTMQTPKGKAEEQSGLSTGLLVLLAIIAALIILAVFILLFFCIYRKKPAYKKKKSSTEYATKGHPVVFPDEMPPHDDETNGATAAITTPMLVAQEHPPLSPPSNDPSTTLHENPLYKPPAGGTRQPPPYVSP